MNICRSKDGFIKLHYKITDSDIWWDDSALVAFLRMISFAHFEDNFTSIRFKGEQRHLKRGEFSATVKELATLVNMPVGTLRDVLARLEKDSRISRQSDNRTTIFCICNYAKYQDVPSKPSARHPANDPANDPANATGGKKNIQNIQNNIYTSNSNELDDLHNFVCELFGKNSERFKLSKARKNKLQLRVKEFSVDDVRKAFTALSKSRWHRGDNDRGWSVDSDPYWLVSSYEKTEKWVNKDSEPEDFGDGAIDITKLKVEDQGDDFNG